MTTVVAAPTITTDGKSSSLPTGGDPFIALAAMVEPREPREPTDVRLPSSLYQHHHDEESIASSPSSRIHHGAAGSRPSLRKAPMLGLAGKKGSGKDTVAAYIRKHSAIKWKLYSFAFRLRGCVPILTGGLVSAEETLSTAGKAIPLPLKCYGKTIGDCIERLYRCFEPWANVSIVSERKWREALNILFGTDIFIREDERQKFLHPLGARIDVALGVPFAAPLIVGAGPNSDAPCLPVLRGGAITVGILLQLLGTDIGRAIFGGNVWVDAVKRDWAADGYPPIIITDVRFPEELVWIRSEGGLVVKVLADKRLAMVSSVVKDGRSATHASETALDVIPSREFACVLENNGTLAELAHTCATQLLWIAILFRCVQAISLSSAELLVMGSLEVQEETKHGTPMLVMPTKESKDENVLSSGRALMIGAADDTSEERLLKRRALDAFGWETTIPTGGSGMDSKSLRNSMLKDLLNTDAIVLLSH